MAELHQSCGSLVNASLHDEGEGSENNAEISAELQRERQRNAELMERISLLEARLRERDAHDSLVSYGQGKPKRQKDATNEDITTDLEIKHCINALLPAKDSNIVDNRVVNWMSINDTESLQSEILKETDSTEDFEVTYNSNDDENEEVKENEYSKCDMVNEEAIVHVTEENYGDEASQKTCNNILGASNRKHLKLGFCPKEVKRIIESEELSMRNAHSHTIRKIIVFASLGIRHGCEDMYELDFNQFSILRKGQPYVSSKDPGEHVLYENPGVRRKIFYPNRQNPTLCPLHILEEEKAMRPSDSNSPSFLFLCIKYGGRTRNIPQNEYVRQRMGRNKLKSFGPAICRMAMLVHIRSGSFFFKALGITLLFMAGFSDDLVQRETKYRNLDLLQKYYRTDEDAEGEELFMSPSATTDNDAIPISQQLMGKKMSAKSRSRNTKLEVLRNDLIQTQTRAEPSIPNPKSNQQSSYPIFPPHPTSSFFPVIYWPPPNAFLPYPHSPSNSYRYPVPVNYITSYPQPYFSNPLCNTTMVPRPLKDSWKDDDAAAAAASQADNGSNSSSSSTEPSKVEYQTK